MICDRNDGSEIWDICQALSDVMMAIGRLLFFFFSLFFFLLLRLLRKRCSPFVPFDLMPVDVRCRQQMLDEDRCKCNHVPSLQPRFDTV